MYAAETTTPAATPKTYTFEGKEIPQKLIDQHRKMQESDAVSASAMSTRSGTIISKNFLKQAEEFLGEEVVTTKGRKFTNLLYRINRPGQSATVPMSVDGTVRSNDQGKQDPRDAANFEDIQESQADTEGTGQTAAAPTQEQRVRQTLEESDTPLTIKEIAEQTDILEPNVRRITGQGAKTGKFERVAPGVYTLTTPDGKTVAHIEVGDAVDAMPKLAKEIKEGKREPFDMIFLDPAYFSSAVVGNNRGIKKYEFMLPPEFKKAMESVPDLIKNNDGHVYLMLSGARTAQKDMLPYLNAMNEVGLSVVGEGSYTKLNE